MKDGLTELLMDSDLNTNGEICMSEFFLFLKNPAAVAFLNKNDIDVVALLEVSATFFKDGRTYTPSELIAVLLDLRGSNYCTVRDLTFFRQWLDSELDKLR